MKFQVKVEDRVFEVEVGDLQARPILATIEGETFEVWPEAPATAAPAITAQAATAAATPVTPAARPATPAAPTASASTNGARISGGDASSVLAPLPGTIVAVAVQPGASVSAGQELCTLEAMKMKNVVRAARAGQIAAVHVSVGQTVKHKQKLMDFA